MAERKDTLISFIKDLNFTKNAAGHKKTKMSRQRIIKEINGSRSKYQETRKTLKDLESKQKRLNDLIQVAQKDVTESRKKMLRLSEVVQKMDLADCNYAVFYENDRQDVAYVIDKEEYHVQFSDDGVTENIPMPEYLRQHRRSKESNPAYDEYDCDEMCDDNLTDVADSSILPDFNRLEDPSSPRSEEGTREDLLDNLTEFPNLRFGD